MTNRQALTKTASKSIKKLFYFVIILVFIAGEIMEGGSATKSPFKLKLYLIRHAETVANKENVLQGHIDFPLTDEGSGQALRLGELLSGKPWTKVYSSDLQRACTSAALILSKSQHWREEHGISKSNLLRELSFGLREGLPRSLSMAEVRQIKSRQFNIPEHQLTDTAETPESAKARQHLFLKQLYRDLRHHQREHHSTSDVASTVTFTGENQAIANNHSEHVPKIAVVSHGGFIKLFLRHYCNYHSSEKIDNCSASIITVSWLEDGNEESYQCIIDPTQINLSPKLAHIP